jgi:Heterokaryon incompatibility protein (HET)
VTAFHGGPENQSHHPRGYCVSDMSAAGNHAQAVAAPIRLSQAGYQYDTLTESQFRLFKLAAYNEIAPSGVLETYDISDCPQFRALSYTWGSAVGPITDELDRINTLFIDCDNETIEVTTNAFDACLHLSISDTYQNQYFFIDTICINQADLQERAQQVLEMGEIYSNALEVIIWLGKPTIELGNVIWATEILLPKLDEISPPPAIARGRIFLSSVWDPGVQDVLGIERLPQKLRGFSQFCSSRRWFRRAWTFQEFVLARRVKVLCGPTELSFQKLARVSHHLTISGWAPQANAGSQNPHLDSTAGIEPARISDLQRVFRAVRHGHIESEVRGQLSWLFAPRSEISYIICWLFWLVVGIHSLKSTDKRDKIYCLLGLADRAFPAQQSADKICSRPIIHEEGDLLAPGPGGRSGKIETYIRPDYTLEVNQVYGNFTKLVLEHSQRLSLLSFVEDPSDRELVSAPSWVPDYGVQHFAWPLPYYTLHNKLEPLSYLLPTQSSDDENGSGLSNSENGNLSAENVASRPTQSVVVELNTLVCCGAAFDTVREVCSQTADVILDGDHFDECLKCAANYPKLPTANIV